MTAQTRLKKKEGLQASSGIRRRKLADRIATIVVTTGGVAVILCIIAILVFIGVETVPLWQGVKSELTSSFFLKESPDLASYSLDSPDTSEFPFLVSGMDEYKEIGFVATKNGGLYFLSLENGKVIKKEELPGLGETEIRSSYVSQDNRLYAFGTDDGRIIPLRTGYKVSFEGDNRIIAPQVTEDTILDVAESPLVRIAFEENDDETASAGAAYTAGGELILKTVAKSRGLIGGGKTEEASYNITPTLNGGKVTALEIDKSLRNLYVGTDNGMVYRYNIRSKQNPELLETLDATGNRRIPVTALGFLLGDRSLVVGDEAGDVSVWFEVSDRIRPEARF
ncbi:MAG: hypothetical protein R3B51_11445 [Thermodesulfobacteriota bacterium]